MYLCRACAVIRCVHICMRMQTRHARPRRMRTNAKKLLVQHLPHKRTSKHSAGHLLAARMNVRTHQYDCECIFLYSTNSRRIAFACSPNIRRMNEWKRMLFTYTSTLCILHVFLRSFHVCVQMWTRLYSVHAHARITVHPRTRGSQNHRKIVE